MDGRELLVYHVKNGDVLGLIAQRYRVRIDDLRRWNNIKGSMIRTGQRLNVWVLPTQKLTQSKGTVSTEKVAAGIQPE